MGFWTSLPRLKPIVINAEGPECELPCLKGCNGKIDLDLSFRHSESFSRPESIHLFSLLSLALPQEDHHSTPLGRHEKRNKELFSFVVVDLRAKLFSDWMDEKQDGVFRDSLFEPVD
ncbi:hypothetical protein CEXT_301151 [Caerostris extrusa]|uniref:Uncharacterized protein n=1 Tax=Caerostris extrusa TaxID=172846 RepID=A0AAV4RF49_CAEEX|nr:hypothetical protein CEXT_301151 [Caerostris extrusa]